MRRLSCLGRTLLPRRFEVVCGEGGCPKCRQLCVGHFGHVRFKIFVNVDFDGHLVGRGFDSVGGVKGGVFRGGGRGSGGV